MRRLLSLRVPWYLSAAVFAVLLWAGLGWFENLNLYFPYRGLEYDPRVLKLPYEEVRLEAADGVKLYGWFIPAHPKAPVFLFTHGNGGNISHRLEKAAVLHDAGVSVLMVDYRGYGASEGKPSEKGLYADALAMYRWLVDVKKVRPDHVILHGESLGGAVAVELATKVPVGGLIIESSFTSTTAMGKKVFPFLPVGLIVRQKYDSLGKLSAVKVPVLVMHSPQDEIIPFAMGKELFAAANEPKQFVELRGGHNDGVEAYGKLYPDAIKEFLSVNLGPK